MPMQTDLNLTQNKSLHAIKVAEQNRSTDANKKQRRATLKMKMKQQTIIQFYSQHYLNFLNNI